MKNEAGRKRRLNEKKMWGATFEDAKRQLDELKKGLEEGARIEAGVSIREDSNISTGSTTKGATEALKLVQNRNGWLESQERENHASRHGKSR